MRNANSQLPHSMILVRALHQPPAPHVSHAETGGENFEPAFAAAQLRRGSPRRSVCEGGRSGDEAPLAFSSEVGAGSREENASKQEARARS